MTKMITLGAAQIVQLCQHSRRHKLKHSLLLGVASCVTVKQEIVNLVEEDDAIGLGTQYSSDSVTIAVVLCEPIDGFSSIIFSAPRFSR